MTSLKDRLIFASRGVVQSWVTWLAIGAVAGAAILLGPGMSSSDAGRPSASGDEIETAVAQAEGRGNAVRAASGGEN